MNTFRIIGLTALTLLSVIPMTKPVTPTLTIQLFTQPISFTFWSHLLSNVTAGTPTYCGTSYGNTWIATYTLGFNFTANLGGHDPGSTFILFKYAQVPVTVFVPASNISTSLINTVCHFSVGPTVSDITAIKDASLASLDVGSFGIGSLDWRVPASTVYALFSVQTCQCQPRQALPLIINATESWTVTTIT